MGNELVDWITLYLPGTGMPAGLLMAMVGAIGVVAWRRAGPPFPVVAALDAVKLWRRRVRDWLRRERVRVALLHLRRWGVAHAGSLLLAGLLAFLLIGQVVSPGFTEYWGYQVGQLSAVAVAVAFLGEARRGRPARFSWEARVLIVAAAYADCLGNVFRFYHRFETFDQIIHFVGTATVTMLCAETVALLARRGKIAWRPGTQIGVAIAIGIAISIGWEAYEYVGDVVFDTGRVQSPEDTRLDVISDVTGALVAGMLVTRRRAEEEEPAEAATRELAGAD